MQQPYRLVTLGGLRLERAEGGVVTGVAAQQRALVVLAAIALAGVKGVSRDWLVALLWPESEEERARHVLAQLLYNLRRGLDAQSPIAAAGRQLWLDLSVVRADVRTFLDALREGSDAGALAAHGVESSGVCTDALFERQFVSFRDPDGIRWEVCVA